MAPWRRFRGRTVAHCGKPVIPSVLIWYQSFACRSDRKDPSSISELGWLEHWPKRWSLEGRSSRLCWCNFNSLEIRMNVVGVSCPEFGRAGGVGTQSKSGEGSVIIYHGLSLLSFLDWSRESGGPSRPCLYVYTGNLERCAGPKQPTFMQPGATFMRVHSRRPVEWAGQRERLTAH